MSPARRLDLADAHRLTVQRILAELLPGVAVWAFGSRVTGRAKPFSDLDLVVMTDTPLSLARRADLVEAFDTSDLPIRVDLVDWASTSPEFRALIEADRLPLLQPSPALPPE